MFYDVTHSCGHVERVNLFGPGKERDWRRKMLESELCPDCRAAEFARKCAQDAKEAKAMDLPSLSGSEKQVAWAEQIRMGFVRAYEEADTNLEPEYAEYADAALHENRAKWWIDNREHLWSASTVWDVLQRKTEKNESSIPESVLDEMMLSPEVVTQDAVATLKCSAGSVIADCGCRNDNFSEIVKGLGYRWYPSEKNWKLKITASSGHADDRLAELGSKLLDAGFSILVSDENVRQKIESGVYDPVYPRWVTSDAEKFLIRWERGNDDIYNAAKAVPGARWERALQGVTVPARQYKVVLDLADSFDFRLSPGANALADSAREAERRALLVSPTVRNAESPKSNGLDAVLSSSLDVIPDLIDDDT